MIYKYINGNRKIHINCKTGTKIRFILDDESKYKPQRPENLDLNLSYQCQKGCEYCYLNANEQGEQYQFNKDELDKLFSTDLTGLEVAMNINVRDNLETAHMMSKYLRSKNCIPNFTVNYETVKHWDKDTLEYVNPEWLGISVENVDQILNIFFLMQKLNFRNYVFHIINGIFDLEGLILIRPQKMKFMLLGYKSVGRGKTMKPRLWNIDNILKLSQDNLVSFDNLMVKQTDILNKYPEFNDYFLGEDGQHSFYIDLVKNRYSKSSTEIENNFDIENNSIIKMFKKVSNGTL